MGLLYFNKFITQSFQINHKLTPLYLQKIKNLKDINRIKLFFFKLVFLHPAQITPPSHPTKKTPIPNTPSSTSLISVNKWEE